MIWWPFAASRPRYSKLASKNQRRRRGAVFTSWSIGYLTMIYVIHVCHDFVTVCGVSRAILPRGLLREINGCVVVRIPQRGIAVAVFTLGLLRKSAISARNAE
jgi:hypothetical protein